MKLCIHVCWICAGECINVGEQPKKASGICNNKNNKGVQAPDQLLTLFAVVENSQFRYQARYNVDHRTEYTSALEKSEVIWISSNTRTLIRLSLWSTIEHFCTALHSAAKDKYRKILT